MSETVNKIIFTKKGVDSREDLLKKVCKQLDIVLNSGYHCFISEFNQKGGGICIEFCVADNTGKNKDIPQPCWLFLDELEYLSTYQLNKILQDAKETVSSIEEELEQDSNNSNNDEPKYDA